MENLKMLLEYKKNLDKSDLRRYVLQSNSINYTMCEYIQNYNPSNIKVENITIHIDEKDEYEFLDRVDLCPNILQKVENNSNNHIPYKISHLDLMLKNRINVCNYLQSLFNYYNRQKYKYIDSIIIKNRLTIVFQYDINEPFKEFSFHNKYEFHWYHMPLKHIRNIKCNGFKSISKIYYKYI